MFTGRLTGAYVLLTAAVLVVFLLANGRGSESPERECCDSGSDANGHLLHLPFPPAVVDMPPIISDETESIPEIVVQPRPPLSPSVDDDIPSDLFAHHFPEFIPELDLGVPPSPPPHHPGLFASTTTASGRTTFLCFLSTYQFWCAVDQQT